MLEFCIVIFWSKTMKSHWTEHKGKRVFIAEYSNFGTDTASLFTESSEILQVITKEEPNSVLIASNLDGTVATPANLEVFKNTLPISNHFIKKRAAVGLTGIRRTFLDIINKLTGNSTYRAFDRLEDALDWLVEE